MTVLRLSANRLGIKDRCDAAYRYYAILNRRPVGKSSGLIAGLAVHDAAPIWKRGGSVAEQDAAIDAVLAEHPIIASEKEYRTAAYIKDAWAAFRPELEKLFAHWVIDEMEQQGVIVLGTTRYRSHVDGSWQEATVEWEFRRDLVGVDPCGDRWIVDYKSSSRDEQAALKAYQNSGQFIGYDHSWRVQYPDKPLKGVQPIRLVMRKPTKGGVAFKVPPDGPVIISDERRAEWVRHTLRKARDILERDPQQPDDWPLACAEVGGCRTQYGCCDYIDTCLLPPSDRALKLSTDEFENSDAGKVRDAANGE